MIQEIALNKIKIGGTNPRKNFKDKSLKELTDSIKENGVLQAILVRPNGTGETFELIAGERRVRASLNAGLVTIPALVKDVNDSQVLQLQIIENLQRENVSYFEEAQAIAKLRNDLSLDVKEICKRLGKSDMYVYSQLALARMPEETHDALMNNHLTKGVAWEIAKLPNPDYQKEAVAALARKSAGKMIVLSTAQKWINERFGEDNRKVKQKNGIQKAVGNDHGANWKKYLLTFDCRQFERFKTICRGRTDTETMSQAVEVVMIPE